MHGNIDMAYHKLKMAAYLDMRSTNEVNGLFLKHYMFQLLKWMTNLNLYRIYIQSIKYIKTVQTLEGRKWTRISEAEDLKGQTKDS